MAESLSDFFSKTPDVTLNDCDREPLHQSSAVQDIGGLLAVDQTTQRVVVTTSSMREILGVGDRDLIGASLEDLSGSLQQSLRELEPEDREGHFSLSGEFSRDGVPLECMGHESEGRWILEFFPNQSLELNALRQMVRKVGRDGSRIVNAASLTEAAEIAAHCIRKLTGFARVNIYKFASDWSGKVIAEARADHMQSFLGLHFPESDIPQQARALYALIPFRAIASVDDSRDPLLHDASFKTEPLDLSKSIIRSVSPMHTAYLRNMGVGSSFSLALNQDGKLWGLIACHSDEPGLPPLDAWSLSREVGNSLMAFLKNEEVRQSARKIVELRKIERSLSHSLAERGEFQPMVEEISPSLLQLLEADGFAFKHGREIQVAGVTPPLDFIREFVEWLSSRGVSDVTYSTTALYKEWPRAEEFMQTACGALAQPVRANSAHYMIWFRGPLAGRVHWAGEPTTKFEPSDRGTLETPQPRASFAAWRAENSGVSREWSDVQARAASDSLREVLAVIAEMSMLSDENDMLRSFAAAAAHDIKTPLRGINFALSVMAEEEFEPSAVREFHDIAMLSATRLSELTSSLVEITSLNRDSIPREEVDLQAALEEVEALLALDVHTTKAQVHVEPIPPVLGDRSLLVSLFLNLVTNSIKFRRPEDSPKISIRGAAKADRVEIEVTDNGIGIPKESIEKVFKPLVRLHNKQKFEGTGLGLAICSRIVELHGGTIHIDPSYESGAKIVVCLPQVSS